ncbi:MAG TPA: prenyltransferase [Acidimicrobiia bacterium]|nr:prenyltransferase [Acidimicrobiia bacterium]
MTDVSVPTGSTGATGSAGSPGSVERPQSLTKRWLYVLATTNPPRGELDPVSKWLYLTRAGVLPMTLVSAALAGLLAAFRNASVAWGWFALAAVGLVLAHMANNLMNDLFDLEVGTDTENYPRNLYSPHPVLSGTISRRGLAGCALVVNTLCLAIMLVLFVARGAPILGFALGGFLLSLAYTAPPLRLKKRGLGEPTVIAVWGPLMVGGTYYAATGAIPGAVILASLPYAILSTTVLMGKHIDKLAWDAPAGTHTLPVMLGEARARVVTRGMFVAFYLSVIALVIAQILPIGTLLVVLSLPIARNVWRAFGEPKPAESPVPNPVWPLWFAPNAFILTRRAGGLLVLGMILGVIVNH